MNQKTLKRKNQIKIVLHILMSGMLVLSTILPLTMVFAESESTQSEPVPESSSERLEETEATIEKQSVESDTTAEKNSSTDTQKTNPPMPPNLLALPNPDISIPLDQKTYIWMHGYSQINGVNDGNIDEDYGIYGAFNDVQGWTYNDFLQEYIPGVSAVDTILTASNLVNGLIDGETALELIKKYEPEAGFTTIDEVQEWADEFFTPYIGKSLQEEELTALLNAPIEIIDDPDYSNYLIVKDPLVYNFVDNNVNVKIHYVYSDGSQAGEDRELAAYIGKSSVTIDSPVIEGYEADQPTVNVDFAEEGLTEYTVTYYKPGELPQLGGQVTIQYMDEEGNELSEATVLSGNIGDPYSSEQKEFSGYTLKEVKGTVNGTFGIDPQLVVYVYQKEASSTNQSTTSNDKKPTDSTTPSEKGAASNGQKPKESGSIPSTIAQNHSFTSDREKKLVEKENKTRKDSSLPRTNEQIKPLFSIMGVVLVLVTLLGGLWYKNKKRNS